jgi:hypothetical protein
MSYSYQESVDKSYEDLLNYSEKDIKNLAKKLNITYIDKDKTAKKIAEKLMYIHRKDIPDNSINTCPNMKISEISSSEVVISDNHRSYLKRFTDQDIKEKSSIIYSRFIKFKDSVGDLTIEDLENIFKSYDEQFFNGDIERYMKNKKYKLIFKTDGEPTFTTEGVCSNTRCSYIITLPIKKFKKGAALVGGILCKDQLECLQRAMEHELTHLIIFMFCGDEIISDQHGELYMNMVSGYFRHEDYRHYIF